MSTRQPKSRVLPENMTLLKDHNPLNDIVYLAHIVFHYKVTTDACVLCLKYPVMQGQDISDVNQNGERIYDYEEQAEESLL